jgi:hypothetical protein
MILLSAEHHELTDGSNTGYTCISRGYAARLSESLTDQDQIVWGSMSCTVAIDGMEKSKPLNVVKA